MKKAMPIMWLILILVFGVFVAFFAGFSASELVGRRLSGEWTAEIDRKEQAAAAALSWLQDVEAVSLSLEDIEKAMPDLKVQVSLAFEWDLQTGGHFRSSVWPESYTACRQAAYEAYAGIFQTLLAERLRMAGYEGATDEAAVEALAVQTFGMSTVDYLMSYATPLMPSLEELQAEYEGSGSYEVSGDVLSLQFDAEEGTVTKTERYIRKGSTLILLGEAGGAGSSFPQGDYPVIYTLEQPQKSAAESK